MSEKGCLIASALKYSIGDNAPQVIAQGKGEVAKKILALAAQYDVDIVQDSSLADRLITLNVQDEIPEQLYLIVAEILSVILDYKDNG